MEHTPVSLVCTVLNEADNIAALLDSMLAQMRAPDEIVVNDCGSRDGTQAIVARYAARDGRVRLVRGGFNISSGRNHAIACAAGPLIACTDAGLTLDRDWLGQIVAPLEAGSADLVAGFFQPAPRSLWELALGATNYRRAEEIDPARFLPFGQSVAFRKQVWQAVGGFPEWASHCEDLLFAQAVERAGFRRTFVPAALVYFRPRPTPAAFFRQYYQYARGDGHADLWRRRHLLRYAVYGGAALALVGLQILPQRRRDAEIQKKSLRPFEGLRAGLCVSAVKKSSAAALLLGTAAYTRGPYRRLWPQLRGLRPSERAYALALVPLIRLIGDVAKMAGYPVGVVRRRRIGLL